MSITEAADRLAVRWAQAWMRYASLTPLGRLATRIATWAPLPYLALLRTARHGQAG